MDSYSEEEEQKEQKEEVKVVVEDLYGPLVPKDELLKMVKDKKRIDNVQPNFYINPVLFKT